MKRATLDTFLLQTVRSHLMDSLHNRLNFDLDKKNKIFHRSLKVHLKIGKTAKCGCEM